MRTGGRARRPQVLPWGLVACALMTLLALGMAPAGVQEGASGIAARYAGDRGIGDDPRVLLHEDFETGDVAELSRRWTNVSNQDGRVLALESGGPTGRGRCLRMTATPGENTGGHLYKRLPREVDTLHARFYVRFPGDAAYIHHFVHLGGYRPATNWPQGGAGERPRGDDRVTVGIEPYGERGRWAPPGIWTFYAYWHEMRQSADGRYWGNSIRSDPPAVAPRGRWQCVEVMLKLNSAPDRSDGELALWLDGRPAYRIGPGTRRGPWTGMGFETREKGEPFDGFRWRAHAGLRLNFFWLLHYVTENAARQNNVAPPTVPNRVWFDDIVVATEYVGPVRMSR